VFSGNVLRFETSHVDEVCKLVSFRSNVDLFPSNVDLDQPPVTLFGFVRKGCQAFRVANTFPFSCSWLVGSIIPIRHEKLTFLFIVTMDGLPLQILMLDLN
jgi:hypothetical protein